MSTDYQIQQLLSSPEALLQKRPYLRQVSPGPIASLLERPVAINSTERARIPALRHVAVSEAQLLAELDPDSHKVLFDDNIPSITVKTTQGGRKGYVDIEYRRMAFPFQQNIRDKQVLHLCTNRMSHIMLNSDPTPQQQLDFMRIKQAWDERNMEGLKTEMVSKAKGQGLAGLLFYFDRNGRVKARTLSYADGYQICSHSDDNGDRILEAVYYAKDGVEYIDAYDDQQMYRYTNDAEQHKGQPSTDGWRIHEPVPHGFSEIPLITKHCRVAWDRVQNIIEVYEVNANIFAVCQKRFGWGILYVKGSFNPSARKIAGSVVLNDNSMDDNADAKFLSPPTPSNMIEYLEYLEQMIQKGSGTTFLLPKDIKISGDTSGVAIQLTQELDMETANNGIIQWQNVASKMMRLFKQGLATELVLSGQDPTAITAFDSISISSKFVPWRPQSDSEYNSMLLQLAASKGISRKTFVEKNTLSTPDELARLAAEAQQEATAQLQSNAPDTDTQ